MHFVEAEVMRDEGVKIIGEFLNYDSSCFSFQLFNKFLQNAIPSFDVVF